MLTLHRAALLVADPADPTVPPVTDGAVLVDGGRIAALGPYRELAGGGAQEGSLTGARVREWDGVLTPGLRNPYGRWLLETAYHPDPREELGEQPLLVPVADGQRGPSARRGLQRMLGHGTTAVVGPFEHPAVRTAVARSGLTASAGGAGAAVLDGGAEGGLDPLAGAALAAVADRPLVVGGPADFAVFAAGSVEELERRGAGCCLATVLGGRLVYRRR